MSYEKKQQFKERLFRHILELDTDSLQNLFKEPVPYDNLNDVHYSAPVGGVSTIRDEETGLTHLNGDVPLGPLGPLGFLWASGNTDRYPHLLIHYDGLNPFEMLMRLWNVCHRPPDCGEIGYLPNGRQIFDIDSTNSRSDEVHGKEYSGEIADATHYTTYMQYILPMMNVLYVHVDTTSLGESTKDILYESTTALCNLPPLNSNFKFSKFFPLRLPLLEWAVRYANIAVIQHILKFRPLSMNEITSSIEYNRCYERKNDSCPCDQDFSKSVAHLILQKCTAELVNTFTRYGYTIWNTLFYSEDVVRRPNDYRPWLDKLLEMGALPTLRRLKTTPDWEQRVVRLWSDEFKKKQSTVLPKDAYEIALECQDEEEEAVYLAKQLWRHRLVVLDPKRWPILNDNISAGELKAMYEGHPAICRDLEPPFKKRKQ